MISNYIKICDVSNTQMSSLQDKSLLPDESHAIKFGMLVTRIILMCTRGLSSFFQENFYLNI